jgi:hypothetical protein
MASFISTVLFPPLVVMPPPTLTLQLVKILLTSTALHHVLPEVRLRALIETASAQDTDDAVRELVMDTLCGSPYLPEDKKTIVIEYCLNEDWDALASALQCQEHLVASYIHIREASYARFRAMVISIFLRSKKIQSLSADRRRQLGAIVYSATSAEQLMEITLAALQQSVVFDSTTKETILNDILDKRYDLLLLPDRFDCEDEPGDRGNSRAVAVGSDTNESIEEALVVHVQKELQQVHSQEQSQEHQTKEGGEDKKQKEGLPQEEEKEEEEECPVCLGVEVVDTLLPCGHEICHQCVTDWAKVHGEPCPCPMCREDFSLSACRPRAT